ncbi:MAG TPA: SDR family oxidoreductase [Rhizomicrobium sp.]
MPPIAVMGANGLIGFALASDLRRRGFDVRGHARRFTRAQRTALAEAVVEASILSLSDDQLAELLGDADIVINTIGVLQGPDTERVHHDIVARLARICAARRKLLVHISVPGDALGDRTAFSRSKRAGEAAIAASGAPFVMLRPGFVIASGAYGGSALIRALAALPFDLPRREAGAVFAVTAICDLCETVARVFIRWRQGEKDWSAVWDVMEERPGTVADVVAEFRRQHGGPAALMTLPSRLMDIGAVAGDLVSLLGWRPPIRTTALAEMRRGVQGDPSGWMAMTGIEPLSLPAAVHALPATVQENWFARLYLLKSLALMVLVVFWCASGAIALTAAFTAARQILLDHGFDFGLAQGITIGSSLLDISVGLAIAFRRTCRAGLIGGILVSLGYMAGAAILTPDMWTEPLGALVKTGPAIVLMLFCLAVSDDR